MKKKLIIALAAAIFVIFFLIIYNILTTPQSMPVETSQIDMAEIEGQIEYVDIDKEGTTFLTYRETAFAHFDHTGELTLLSDQVVTGTVIDVWYWEDKTKALIKLVNDPAALSGMPGFNETENENLYATYNFENKKIDILPAGPLNCWLAVDTIVGVKDNIIFEYGKTGWAKQKLNIGTNEPIVSSYGKLAGNLENETLHIYDIKGGNKVRSINISPVSLGETRIFDNGDVLVVDGTETIRLYQSSGKLKKIKVPEDDQILVGKNIFVYSGNKKHYAYFPNESKTYQLRGLPKDIDYLNIFGLSVDGAAYYVGDNYVFDLYKFGKS